MHISALFLLPLVAITAAAQIPNPFANDAQAAGVGKGIFRIYCAPCHGIRGQGRRGPNLSRAGRQRSYAYLRASIVDPSANITPGYGAVSVVLRDGRKILGVERGLDNFTVQMMDLAGTFYSFDKVNVSSVKRET